VRGHNLFNGYLGRADATDAVIVDGWFRTGDLGRYAEGVLTIVDRKKDMIVRSGYNVYPTEVDELPLGASGKVLKRELVGRFTPVG